MHHKDVTGLWTLQDGSPSCTAYLSWVSDLLCKVQMKLTVSAFFCCFQNNLARQQVLYKVTVTIKKGWTEELKLPCPSTHASSLSC